MEALQETFWDGAQPAESPFVGWRERVKQFNEQAAARGGLLPRASISALLGCTKTNVSFMCHHGMLEEINFYGSSFVSGRSIAHALEQEKNKGGRGKRRVSLWQTIRIGYHVGTAAAEIIAPDSK